MSHLVYISIVGIDDIPTAYYKAVPGAAAKALRAGKNTAPDGVRGTIRWREWLAQHLRHSYRSTNFSYKPTIEC